MSARPAEKLSIAVAQLNSTVGDIVGNVEKARAACATAAAQGADIVVFPELFIAGYPPEDLVLKPAFQAGCRLAIETLARETSADGPALLVGTPWLDAGKLYNAVALLEGGAITALRYKVDLPNYGVFDEKRVFTPGPMPGPVNFRGVRLGIPICEDIWGAEVVECLAETGAEMLVVPNGSPYWRQKGDVRINIAVARVTEQGLPTIYVNQVGGQDELVFDGVSFGLHADCSLAFQFAAFQETVATTHWVRQSGAWRCENGPQVASVEADRADYSACVLGLRDYVNKNGFPGVVLGLSGGIDSALCAAMAVDALGADRVRCMMLPYKFTSQESLKDAAACTRALGVRYEILPIAAAVEGFEAALAPAFSGLPRDVTEENLQARTRGTILMAISNKFNLMVVTTGNKSEMSVGYATLYGDMNGGFNPIKDLYKTEVFRLARLRNNWKPDGAKGRDGRVIPDNIITRPPTAELRENQKDEDSLPAYAVLDPILERLVEHEEPISAIVAAGFDRDIVMRVDRMINIAEYKRRQAAPGVKVTLKNFGRDRRYPITNRFRDPGASMPAPDVSLITGKPIKSEAFDF
ncbi:MAG: NAD+ synthase [Pseudolabrys sp.]